MFNNYRFLMDEILTTGVRQPNRTGVDTLMLPGEAIRYDLSRGYFPAITSKFLNFPVVAGELIGFLNAYTSAADFRRLGVNIWNKDANENGDWLKNPNRKGKDDLGKIYGYQWRHWGANNGKTIDQLMNVIQTIRENPQSRRIIMTGWNPADINEMALPPCHMTYQFICDTVNKKLHLCMYQRSADMFLGVPFNVASCALLLNIVSLMTGYTPGRFNHFMADCHIYVNHIEAVETLLARDEFEMPTLIVDEGLHAGLRLLAERPFDRLATDVLLESLRPHHFMLANYQHHGAIKAEMSTTPVDNVKR
jgi:thymidylate synthase